MSQQNLFQENVLFRLDGCFKCSVWDEVNLEHFNSSLDYETSPIKLVNCTNWQQTGEPDDPLIEKYDSHLDGFPECFLYVKDDYGNYYNVKIVGAFTKKEILAKLRYHFRNHFKMPKYNPSIFNRECNYIEDGVLRGKVICT